MSVWHPDVRPIVRDKSGKDVEFGVKLSMSLVNGFAYVDRGGVFCDEHRYWMRLCFFILFCRRLINRILGVFKELFFVVLNMG